MSEALLLHPPTHSEEPVKTTDMVLVPRGFLDFVRRAPVSSGVCCCGGDMNHSPYEGHTPVDQWDYSLSQWLDQIAVGVRPHADPSAS